MKLTLILLRGLMSFTFRKGQFILKKEELSTLEIIMACDGYGNPGFPKEARRRQVPNRTLPCNPSRTHLL